MFFSIEGARARKENTLNICCQKINFALDRTRYQDLGLVVPFDLTLSHAYNLEMSVFFLLTSLTLCTTISALFNYAAKVKC
jgi:hypothetical protein